MVRKAVSFGEEKHCFGNRLLVVEPRKECWHRTALVVDVRKEYWHRTALTRDMPADIIQQALKLFDNIRSDV